MHAYDHGVAMHMIHAIVKTIHKLEVDLGLPKNTLLNRLTERMHNLCSSLDTKHTTLMGFTNQSIVTVFETLTTPGKKGQKQSPIVDAGDVQKLMLTLPYLLDGLADEELEAHNSARAVAARIADPIPETCMAINEWLHWYKLFRTPEPTDDDVDRLTDMGKALLSTLERVFPFKVKVGRVSWRSMWCNEKVHSILHAPRTLVRMGRSQNVSCQVPICVCMCMYMCVFVYITYIIYMCMYVYVYVGICMYHLYVYVCVCIRVYDLHVSCQVTETSHKGVKRKGFRSNSNPKTAGMSIMKTQLRESACYRMADALDKTGNFAYLHVYVCIVIVCICMSCTCSQYWYVSVCIRMYHCILVWGCDHIAGGQVLAGTSASVPSQQGTLESHPIPIPTIFCQLHATGRARRRKRRKDAWLQDCAVTYGRAHNPPPRR